MTDSIETHKKKGYLKRIKEDPEDVYKFATNDLDFLFKLLSISIGFPHAIHREVVSEILRSLADRIYPEGMVAE